MNMLEGISEILQQLQDDEVIPLGGMVLPEVYQRAVELSNFFKHEFVRLAENEQQRELHAKVWPYPWTYEFLFLCLSDYFSIKYGNVL